MGRRFRFSLRTLFAAIGACAAGIAGICIALSTCAKVQYRVTSDHENTSLRFAGRAQGLSETLKYDTITWRAPDKAKSNRVPQIKFNGELWDVDRLTPTVVKSWGGEKIDETLEGGSFYFVGSPVSIGAGYVLRIDFDLLEHPSSMYLRVEARRDSPVVVAEDGDEITLPLASQDAEERFGRQTVIDRQMEY